MRQGSCRLLSAIAAIALFGCTSALIHNGAADPKQVATIEASVAHIRELDFTRQVPVVVTSPAQAQRMIVAQIARDHSDQDLRLGGRSGAMTGLYPPQLDLKGQTLALLHEEVVGFYNPTTRQMVVVEKPPELSDVGARAAGRAANAMVLAHELTHALQDQHFGIDRMLQQVKDNDDQTLALKSVAEGDATIAGFGYLAGHLNDEEVGELVRKLNGLPTKSAAGLQGIPLAISVPMLFQYSAGSHFVAEAWRRGGWSSVDSLYRNPPRSSQQIMQPELYFDHPSPPAHIELSGYQQLLPGWRKVDDDTYGELLLKLILEKNLAPNAPALAALPQWAGDRIVTLQKGDQLTLLWLLAFHQPAAAQAFAGAYAQVLEHLGGSSDPHGVAIRGPAVFVAIGPGAREFAGLGSAVWKASTISPPLPN
jgi:hypothetical protein